MSVVSIRINKKTKEILEKAGINITQEIKRHLEELAWRIEVKERLERLDKILNKIPPAEDGFSAKSVREDRDSN